jgi:hypothetical protein
MSVESRNFANVLCRTRKRLDQFAIISLESLVIDPSAITISRLGVGD